MMFFKSYIECPKIRLNDAITYLTVIILTCVQNILAPGGDSALTLELISLDCCVTGVFT
jgi:hypothetical protein